MRVRTSLLSWALRLSLALAALGGGAGEARAGESYYMIVFGSLQDPPRPNYSHSWAVFVRAVGEGCDPRAYQLEYHIISWLPRTMEIRTWAPFPECGHNLDLHSTFAWVLGTRQKVAMWGPYQIEPELYRRAVCRVNQLNSGEVRYKAIDFTYPVDRVVNCIHAVSALAGGTRLRVTTFGYGHPASEQIARKLEPWIIDYRQTHPWVAERLGLNCYPMERRCLYQRR
jgi:hypothetical protein